MSREAKIGLLVALAFLLVIGLLLSDHVTNVNREPPAPLLSTAESIKSSLNTPGGQTTGVIVPQPRTGDAGQPYVFDPATHAAAGETPVIDVSVGQPEPNPVVGGPVASSGGNDWGQPEATPAGTVGTTIDPFAEFRAEADAAGEPVEAVGGVNQNAATPPSNAAPAAVAVADYVVRPGDTLGKIARVTLGADSAANRSAILGLNPKLARNPDLIRVGEVYKVPGSAAGASAVASRRETAPALPPAAGNKGVYEVKSGDTLSEIAQRELGTSRRWKELLTLNADQLDDAADLRVGMRLKLPA